ncbi:MAG: phosphohydrolase [Delftia acidovorans]|nr:MAG: phosphohydrolase [Delftia acidovorans]
MTWKQLYSGKRFYSLAPRPEDICIIDIAHALSMKCRYGGHCKQFYSVAQHSVLVARHASQEDCLRALLHDAHEAYSPFGDITKPDKDAIRQDDVDVRCYIQRVEDNIDRAVAAKFNLPFPIKNRAIDILDTRILHDEREAIMVPTNEVWGVPFEPLGVEIQPWKPEIARAKFLDMFDQASIWHQQYGSAA